LAVIQRVASSSEISIPASRPAASALAASWLSRWIPIASSEWITTRAPARWVSAALALVASSASILKPHQSAQMEADASTSASRSATLYASTAWWKERGSDVELAEHVHLKRDLICPVAVVLDQDVASQDAGESLQLQVAGGRLAGPACRSPSDPSGDGSPPRG
jgi:hypothetical protein